MSDVIWFVCLLLLLIACILEHKLQIIVFFCAKKPPNFFGYCSFKTFMQTISVHAGRSGLCFLKASQTEVDRRNHLRCLKRILGGHSQLSDFKNVAEVWNKPFFHHSFNKHFLDWGESFQYWNLQHVLVHQSLLFQKAKKNVIFHDMTTCCAINNHYSSFWLAGFLIFNNKIG